MNTDSNGWRAGILVAALTAVAAAVRVPGLDQGLWYDEIVTLVVSIREPLLGIVTEYPWNNVHPLYSVLGHLSVLLFGEHAWTVRLPAVLFGVASIPLLYVLAAEVASRREAVFSATILAFSYHHVWFSQNARGYSALAFWALLCTWLLVWARRRASWRVQVAYGCAAALGAYTHLTMGFVIAAHALVVAGRLVLGWRRGVRHQPWILWLSGFALAGLLTGVLYGPLLLQVQDFFSSAPASGAQVATQRWALWEALRGLEVGLGAIGMLLAAPLAGIGFLSYARKDPEMALLFIGPGVLTLVGTVVMQRPVFPRFFFFLIGFAVLLAVRGITTLAARLDGSRPRAGRPSVAVEASLVLVVLGASVVALPAAYGPKQDFDGALRFVNETRAAGEPVLTTGLAAFPYERYYRVPWTVVNDVAELDAARGDGSRAWMVYTFPTYLSAMAPELMRAIDAECLVVRRFRGSVGGGDVIVCTFGVPGARVSPR